MRRYMGLVALLLVVALLGSACAKKEEQVPHEGSTIDFSLPDLQGEQVSLSDFRGKIVLVNVWATWCGYCLQEMPDLQALQDKYPSELTVLAVALDNPEDVRRFIEEEGYTFTVLLDTEQVVKNQFGVRYLPTTIVIDQTGDVTDTLIGLVNKERMEEIVKDLLK